MECAGRSNKARGLASLVEHRPQARPYRTTDPSGSKSTRLIPFQAGPVDRKHKKPDTKLISKLSELPGDVWVDAAHDDSGFQFYTKVRIGLSNHHVMLDGGSAVNSVTEEILVGVLNENKAAGISLNDERHPIRQME